MATWVEIANACKAVAEAALRAERLQNDRQRQQSQVLATTAELQTAVSEFDAAVANLQALFAQ